MEDSPISNLYYHLSSALNVGPMINALNFVGVTEILKQSSFLVSFGLLVFTYITIPEEKMLYHHRPPSVYSLSSNHQMPFDGFQDIPALMWY